MCPICRKEQLTLVSWVFGDHLGRRVRFGPHRRGAGAAGDPFDEFAVHVVEVCRTCSWNHLVKSYVLGAVPPPKGPARHPDGARPARARPVNSEGRHDRSADDARGGRAADGVARDPAATAPPRDVGRTRRARAPRRQRVAARRPPDDDHAAGARRPARTLRDPIDVVKAALDGTPPPKQPPPASATAPSARRRRPARGSALGRRGPALAADQLEVGAPRARTPRWRVLIVLPIVTFAMAYIIVDVPKPGDIRTNQVSTILASDGSELAKIVPPEGNRVDVNIDQIPVHVRNAVMAAEDRDFYSNPGFSFTGFLRAFKNNIFGGDLQGGSTITQQYVKNALVGDARSGVGGMVRKAKELVISTKMSGEWSKDQVLQSYLNIIYFGRGAYGIAAASKAYFDKPVEQLNVAEGALLAALIQRPSGLDPAVDPEGAAERWNWVLDGMVEIGALSPQDRAAQVFPPTVPPEQAQRAEPDQRPERPDRASGHQGTAGPVQHRRADAEHRGPADHHHDRPEGAEGRARKRSPKYLEGQDPDMRSAVVSVDPHTGGVKAYYGGSDANGFDFAQAGLPTGSSFKVFALVAALQQGMGLGYQVDSSPVTVNGIKITNVEGEGCGTCNIAEALKRSLNTSYYRLMLKLKNGPQDVADAAHAGRHRRQLPRRRPHAVRGRQGRTAEQRSRVGPVPDSRAGHGVGVRHDRGVGRLSQAALRAEGRQRRGEVLFDAGQEDNSGEQRIDKEVADNVTSAMQPIAGYSRGHNLAGGRPSAAKTGTNQLGDTDANRDAWMVGLYPVAVDGGLGGHHRRHQATREQVGLDRFTARACRRTSGRRRWTGRSRAPTTRRSRSRRRSAATPACRRRHRRRRHRAATAVGDGDSADDRDRARHHDPVGPTDHRARSHRRPRGPCRAGARAPPPPRPGPDRRAGPPPPP